MDKLAVIKSEKSIKDLEEVLEKTEQLISCIKFLELKGLKIECAIAAKK